MSLASPDLDAVLGTNLRHLREDAGLTPAMLADRLGLGAERLALIEAGHGRLTAPEMVRVARRLDHPLARLFVDPRPERRPS